MSYKHLTHLPYEQIMSSRQSFRKISSEKDDYFSHLDLPTTKYFKILFYFDNGDSNAETMGYKSTGLLAPTWLNNTLKEEDYYMYNSAWSYLKMNGEDERANLLEKFVNLLSNINSKSPWYFSELSGLDAALERKQPMENNFIFEDQRKSITIKCLPDALDNRIGTLMDLYRAVVWSWQTKREIIPSNLRKFDMALYIFDQPTIPFIATEYNSSYKYIEFHNCEFDYNSAKTPYGTLSNAEGSQMMYDINILFDDCYETRYNDVFGRMVGDLIRLDVDPGAVQTSEKNVKEKYADGTERDTGKKTSTSKEVGSEYKYSENNYSDQTSDFKNLIGTIYKYDPETELKNARLEGYPNRVYAKGLIGGALTEIVGSAVDWAQSKIKSAVLGNLYTFSLTDIRDQLKGLASGKVFSTARAVAGYIRKPEEPPAMGDNLFEEVGGNHRTEGSISDNGKTKENYIKDLGNMFKSNTLANNV